MSSVHFPFFPDFKFMQHLITLNCVVSILSTFGKNLMMIFFLLEFFHVVVTLNVCVCVWVCVCAWCTICCNLHQILSIPVESGEGVCLLCKEQQLLQCSNYNNEASDLICTSSVANIWKPTVEKVSLVLFSLPRWEAVDTEIKVPSGENTEFKRSPFKALSSSVYSHICYTYFQRFLAYFYPSSPFTCIFSKTSPNFFLCWLWLTPVPV